MRCTFLRWPVFRAHTKTPFRPFSVSRIASPQAPLIMFSISRLISFVRAVDKKNISAGNLLFQPSKIMKSMSSPGHVSHGIEPLESRIAPAVILVGNPNTTLDVEYSDAPFVNIGTGNDLI